MSECVSVQPAESLMAVVNADGDWTLCSPDITLVCRSRSGRPYPLEALETLRQEIASAIQQARMVLAN